jgi:hypothetical protein
MIDLVSIGNLQFMATVLKQLLHPNLYAGNGWPAHVEEQ